jgi:transketolase
MKATREALGDALVELGKQNKDIVVLDADLAKSTYTEKFALEFPDRFFDCGVAEQNMMSTAAGLAACGKIAYVGSFTIFTVGRAWDQLRNVVAYGNLNVKICPTHSGISVGEDGSSHQPVEDIAMMRALPNMKVIVPADYYEAREAIRKTSQIPGPVFVRLGRPKVPFVYGDGYQFNFGQADVLRKGKDVSIFATGMMVAISLEAADILAGQGIEPEVINVSTIKPLDEQTVLRSARKTGRVVTAEEGSIIGGLGGAIAELLSEKLPTPLKRVGINDRFGTSGPYEELFDYFGLTAKNIAQAAYILVRRT